MTDIRDAIGQIYIAKLVHAQCTLQSQLAARQALKHNAASSVLPVGAVAAAGTCWQPHRNQEASPEVSGRAPALETWRKANSWCAGWEPWMPYGKRLRAAGCQTCSNEPVWMTQASRYLPQFPKMTEYHSLQLEPQGFGSGTGSCEAKHRTDWVKISVSKVGIRALLKPATPARSFHDPLLLSLQPGHREQVPEAAQTCLLKELHKGATKHKVTH